MQFLNFKCCAKMQDSRTSTKVLDER